MYIRNRRGRILVVHCLAGWPFLQFSSSNSYPPSSPHDESSATEEDTDIVLDEYHSDEEHKGHDWRWVWQNGHMTSDRSENLVCVMLYFMLIAQKRRRRRGRRRRRKEALW